jgi:hypothetical protein
VSAIRCFSELSIIGDAYLLKIGMLLLGPFVLVFGMSPASAGVIYTFSGTPYGGGPAEGFTTITAAYISTPNGTPDCLGCIQPGDVAPGTCIGCDPELIDGVLEVAELFPGYPLSSPTYDYIGFFVGSTDTEDLYYFPLNSFSTPGTYAEAVDGFPNVGTLTVSETPEPSTFCYLSLALFYLISLARRTHNQSRVVSPKSILACTTIGGGSSHCDDQFRTIAADKIGIA